MTASCSLATAVTAGCWGNGCLVSGYVTGERARGKQVFCWLFERSAKEVDLDSLGHAFPEEGGGITEMICCYFILLFGYTKT